MIYKPYNKNLTYSYVFGAFGTLELLNNKPKECIGVLISPSFTKNEAFKKIEDRCKENNITIVVDENIISKIRDKGNIFVIGVFKKYRTSLDNSNHLLLYKINDVGTIGTIIRSMRGFLFSNIVLIDCDVDIFDEHLIRSTMGAYFSCNLETYETLEKYNEKHHKDIYYISNKGNDIDSIKGKENISLLFTSNNHELEKVNYIKFDKDISLDNIVNIVLFSLYK